MATQSIGGVVAPNRSVATSRSRRREFAESRLTPDAVTVYEEADASLSEPAGAKMKIDGRCHCGAIRYEASVSPKLVSICHCTDCQTISGAPYRVNVRALRENFRIEGKPKHYVKVGSSGDEVVTTFCGDCGSAVYSYKEGADFVHLRVGAISQRAQLAPMTQGFCQSALPWATDISGVARVP